VDDPVADVWIAVDPDAHVQATGRDDEDRKQYRYHERWRLVRDARKFERLAGFAERLPAVRDDLDELLGNTRAVARSCYVAPQVPTSWRSGQLAEIRKAGRRAGRLTRPERATATVLDET
jgi:DNA topoisomerase IB